MAVLAFASIKNIDSKDSLILMLQDPVMQVRAAAAYALGQTSDTKVTDRLISAFRGKDTLEVNNLCNANILEAVGKTGNLADLKALATVKTYRSTDTLLLLGQARAIFRMALRNNGGLIIYIGYTFASKNHCSPIFCKSKRYQPKSLEGKAHRNFQQRTKP